MTNVDLTSIHVGMNQSIQLCSRVLTELFSLPGRPGCRLLLIGIANSIDFTERRLQLASKVGQLVHPKSFAASVPDRLLEITVTTL